MPAEYKDYKVRVETGRRDAAFLKAIAKLKGVHIVGRSYSAIDREQALTDYLQLHKDRVALLDQPKGPETEDKIALGYLSLWYQALEKPTQHPWLRQKIEHEIGLPPLPVKFAWARPMDLEPIREITKRLFLECTEVPPQDILFPLSRTKWDFPVLSPVEVQCLILRFGLNDGQRRSPQKVSEGRGLKAVSDSTGILYHAISAVSFSLIKQRFIAPDRVS